jgi:hypothetical protein
MANYRRDVFLVAGGAIAHTFGPVTSPMYLKELRVHVSAAPTTSENFTLTLRSVDGAEHDLVIYKIDLSAASTTDIFNTDFGMLLLPGDELAVSYINTDGRTIGVQLIFS